MGLLLLSPPLAPTGLSSDGGKLLALVEAEEDKDVSVFVGGGGLLLLSSTKELQSLELGDRCIVVRRWTK